MPLAIIPPRRRTLDADNYGYLSAYQDTDETQDYTIDWSQWLGDDSIVSSSWEVSGVTLESSDYTPKVVVAFLSGTAGTAKNTIVTQRGRTHIRTIKILSRVQ